MLNDKSNQNFPINNDEKYNLANRTLKFAEQIILLTKKIPSTPITIPIINQLIRAGTSIGANYCEADNAESKKDFHHKIGLCKKESRETMYWLQLSSKAVSDLFGLLKDIKIAWKEAHELTLIFGAINRKK